MSRRNILVYIASPYTRGHQASNVRTQLMAWDAMFDMGVSPVAPLWTHYQHIFTPRSYEEWTEYDNAIIDRCDACYRSGSNCPVTGYKQYESDGADTEVKRFTDAGKPVFYSLLALQEWLKENGHELKG